MARNDNKKRLNSFSLVELLIVISIIAILASMIMPAVNSAFEAGRSAACQNNQKNIYNGMLLYTSDYYGFSPPGYSPKTYNPILPNDSTTFHWYWPFYIEEYAGEKKRLSMNNNGWAEENAWLTNTVFDCPSNTPTYLGATAVRNRYGPDGEYGVYYLAFPEANSTGSNLVKSITRAVNPGETILCFDSPNIPEECDPSIVPSPYTTYGSLAPLSSGGRGYGGDIHNGEMNMMLMDGHMDRAASYTVQHSQFNWQ